MASVSVTVNIAPLLQIGGPIDRDIQRRAALTEGRAKVLCPVDTGRLRASIQHQRGDRPLVWRVIADTAYASWIHEGERFDPRAGRIVFASDGPRPFLVDALEAAA